MGNKIKIADIVEKNKQVKNYFLLEEYNGKFNTNKEKFYDENKDKEPLKGKIEQLKNFFVIREYGIGYYRPEGDEVELAKELCQSQNIIGVTFPEELYTNTSNQNKDNETFNKIVANLWIQMRQHGLIKNVDSKEDKTLTDNEIKKIIIDLPLPSFETEFQKEYKITKPNLKEINFESQKYDKYDLKTILEAEDFTLYLWNDELNDLINYELNLDFILKNNIGLDKTNSFGLDNVEIENVLFNSLKDHTLAKFGAAERILNFYYKKLKLANNKFDPGFRFVYRILKLYDKKLAEANSQNYVGSFKQLCECAKECTKDILEKNSGVIQSVKNIFNYVNMFETHRTSNFNSNLDSIKQDIVNISTFMKKHLLIDVNHDQNRVKMSYQNDSDLEAIGLNLSVSRGEWWKEFFIFLFTHFLTLCSSDFKIEKSAQLKKLVNFLQTMNTGEISEDQTNYPEYIDNNIKYVYEQTNRFEAFRHLRTTLPEIPKQRHNQDNLLR